LMPVDCASADAARKQKIVAAQTLGYRFRGNCTMGPPEEKQ
jgi:hypothetical protein